MKTSLPAKPAKAAVSVPAPRKRAPAPAAAPLPPTADLSAGKIWKMSGRNGVAFVRDAALAGELLKTDPKNLARAAMAVYYDKKGRAFAWQVRFDTDRWAEVHKRLE